LIGGGYGNEHWLAEQFEAAGDHDDIEGLKAVADREAKEWLAAWRSGDTRTANTFVGEVTDLFDSTKPAADIMTEAETLLSKNFASD